MKTIQVLFSLLADIRFWSSSITRTLTSASSSTLFTSCHSSFSFWGNNNVMLDGRLFAHSLQVTNIIMNI